MKLKTGTTIVAKADQVLVNKTIPKGSVGHISRISPRLKKAAKRFNLRNDPEGVCVKFPGSRSFITLTETIEIFQ